MAIKNQLTQCNISFWNFDSPLKKEWKSLHSSVKSSSPIATCAESTAWFMVSAQMCRLCTAVTPFTATKLSRTSLYFSPDGVPDCAGQRRGQSLQAAVKATRETWPAAGKRGAHLPSARWECPSWWWTWCTGQIRRRGRCRWGRPSCILAEWRQKKANKLNLRWHSESPHPSPLNKISSWGLTLKKMMRALTSTLMLCSRSPTTWTKAARTLALACSDLFPWKINPLVTISFGYNSSCIFFWFRVYIFAILCNQLTKNEKEPFKILQTLNKKKPTSKSKLCFFFSSHPTTSTRLFKISAIKKKSKRKKKKDAQ